MKATDVIPKDLGPVPKVLSPFRKAINAGFAWMRRNRVKEGKGIRITEDQDGKMVAVSDTIYEAAKAWQQTQSGAKFEGKPPVTAHFQVTVNEQGQWVFPDGFTADWLELDYVDCDDPETPKKIRILGAVYDD